MALIAWYKLDGNANDSSGNGLVGTISGASSTTAGKINTCYSFDGINDYIDLNWGASWNPATNPITITLWVKSNSPSSNQMFLSSGQSPDANARLYLATYNGKWDGGIFNEGWTGSGLVTATTDWTFIALVMDGTIANMYANGTLTKTKTYTSYTLNEDVYIGQHGSSNTYNFNGLIDDVRIYNHALSIKELKLLNQALILHYGFESPYEEPTENLKYNPVANDWVNSGAWTRNANETDVIKPFVSAPLTIWSGIVTTTGNIHFGFSVTTISPSTTYTISVWFRQNRAGCSAPYMRTNVNNNSLGNFSYSGSTSSSNWPVNQWIRITCTATTQSNENGIYLSNYIGTTIGDKIWYFGYQVEQKDHASGYVYGTRTGIAYDSSGYGNNGVVSTSPSPIWIESNKLGIGAFSFINSSSNVITTPILSSLGLNSFTINMWVYLNGTAERDIPFGNYNDTPHFNFERTAADQLRFYWNGLDLNSSVGTLVSKWSMITAVRNKETGRTYMYLDGVIVYDSTPTIVDLTFTTGFNIGRDYRTDTTGMNGKIDDVRIYATALSAADILTLYNTRTSMDNLGNFYTSYLSEDSNLAPNPSFEYDAVGTVTPTGWTAEASGGPTVSTVDNRKCLTFAGDGVYRRIRSTRYFSVTPGDIIYGKLLLKQATGSLFYFGLLYSDATYSYFTSGAATYDTWAVRSGTLTIPAGVTSAAIWVFNYSGNSGAIYVDNVYVSRYPIEDLSVYDMNTAYSIEKFKIENTGIVESLEFDEYNGIADTDVQHRIEKDGTLIINGEFSEVD